MFKLSIEIEKQEDAKRFWEGCQELFDKCKVRVTDLNEEARQLMNEMSDVIAGDERE